MARLTGIYVNAAFRVKQKNEPAMESADDSIHREIFVKLDVVYRSGKRRGKRECIASIGDFFIKHEIRTNSLIDYKFKLVEEWQQSENDLFQNIW